MAKSSPGTSLQPPLSSIGHACWTGQRAQPRLTQKRLRRIECRQSWSSIARKTLQCDREHCTRRVRALAHSCKHVLLQQGNVRVAGICARTRAFTQARHHHHAPAATSTIAARWLAWPHAFSGCTSSCPGSFASLNLAASSSRSMKMTSRPLPSQLMATLES